MQSNRIRSVKKQCLVILSTCVALSLGHAQQSDTISVTMPTVVVTAHRVPMGALKVNRLIEAIDRSQFDSSVPFSLEDILQSFTTVDLQPRGPFGVQTDVSIRGSLFSQNLILLNGHRINDPQTAHHNFDLPVPIDQIGRIEIMKGPASALYGPDAFGGVINILTENASKSGASVRFARGEHGFMSGSGSFGVSLQEDWHMANSIEYRRSDGYRHDTDFEMWGVSSNHQAELLGSEHSFLLGYNQKRFGALDFYSPGRNTPSKEWTSTAYANLSTHYLISSVLLEPSVFYRRHDDKFMFDIRTPTMFVNTHRTDVAGGRVMGTLQLGGQSNLLGGAEIETDRIRSSRLGNHGRSLTSGFLNAHLALVTGLNLDAGVRYDVSSSYGSDVNPTVGVGLALSDRGKLFAYAGRAFRAPSYTELYYSDPANEGNPGLRPETGWSYELGGQYRLTQDLIGSASLYLRDQRNLIDYVQYVPGGKFYATNFTSASTQGLDLSLEWLGHDAFDFFERVVLQYAFLESTIDRKGVFNSKYSLNHPKHQVSVHVTGEAPFSIVTSISGTYKYRSALRNHVLIDARLSRSFKPMGVFLTARNLLNETYEEIIGVPMPGRWIIAGLEWSMN